MHIEFYSFGFNRDKAALLHISSFSFLNYFARRAGAIKGEG